MSAVRKSFGATQALRGVSFAVEPGEVHALIGENGAGKSTLMKVLSGACRADGGRVELDGKEFQPENPLHARQHGIAMIYQELNLAPHLSVEENILLGAEPSSWGWLNRARRRDLAAQALSELHSEAISLDAPVHTLTIAQQQLVEIARALTGNPKVLIMDEPTSSLTQVDAEILFQVIDRLGASGVSVIYISHFLEECHRVCQRYTVLRDGESVGSGPMSGAAIPGIIRLMVGREIQDAYPRAKHPMGKPALELKGVQGIVKPRSVSLVVRQGEVFGLAGLIGGGRTETLRAVFGLDRLRAGEVWVEGQCSRSESPAQRLREGMGLLSENRKEEGLMLGRSVADNLTLTRFAPVSRWGFIHRRRQQQCAREWMTRLEVRAQGPAQAIGELSGGNQQKVALGRLLHHDARILLLDEPTRGIDVGSKTQIYRLMGELAGQGKAVVFVSSYLPELLGVCDTIGVMCRGVISEVRPASNWTEHDIIRVAVGAPEVEGQGRPS
jgi:ribose transport system ATP-binding protein